MAKRLLPDPDLEALIRKLNSEAEDERPVPARPGPRDPSWPLPEPDDTGREWLRRLLAGAREAHASDLLLVSGTRPMVRIDGSLAPLEQRVLTAGSVALLCAALVPAAHRLGAQSSATADFAVVHEGVGRFRCNVHRARGDWSAAVRLLPEHVPDLESLHLPPAIERFAEIEYGLLIITGPTGCGKSTTLAALMKRILSRRRVHAITIEDPVEYAHPHGESVVEHVEIGRDAPSFSAALRASLRQDPDVLLIGEMRDPESIGIAITAAETGHLVLSTLHTGDGPQTINRILDSYPSGQAEQVRVQLSISLAGIVSQQLLPRRDGGGRVPAVEILVATHAVRNLIRRNKIAHIRAQFALEKQAGMLSLDNSLAQLVNQGMVDEALARARAREPEDFDRLLKNKRGQV